MVRLKWWEFIYPQFYFFEILEDMIQQKGKRKKEDSPSKSGIEIDYLSKKRSAKIHHMSVDISRVGLD